MILRWMAVAVLAAAFFCARPLYSQVPGDPPEVDRSVDLRPTAPVPLRSLRSEDVLYPRQPSIDGAFSVYGFQRYEDVEIGFDALQSAPGSEVFLMESLYANGDAEQPLPIDRGVAMASLFPPSLGRSYGRKHSTAYQLMRAVLMQAVGFGYSYLREKAKTMNASDMDALHLPYATGVYRDMNIIMLEASQRSDYSTMSTWQDILYQQRLKRNRSEMRRELDGK